LPKRLRRLRNGAGNLSGRSSRPNGGYCAKEVSGMLAAEIIKVLGVLFGLLVYVMVWSQLARRQSEADKQVSTGAEKAR
jgi:hypothetical protein